VLLNGYYAKKMKAEVSAQEAEILATQKPRHNGKKRKGKN